MPSGGHIFPDNPPSSILLLKPFIGLREVEFDVQKPSRGRMGRNSFETWALSFINWTKTVVAVLQTLGSEQQMKQVTILWHNCAVGDKAKFVKLYNFTEEWLSLQDSMDCVPALSSAKLVLDMTLLWDDGIPGVTLEEYTNGMCNIWQHPRCFVNCRSL